MFTVRIWLWAWVLAQALRSLADADPVVHMLVPGFTVEELPVRLSNQNNLRFAPDGTLTALGYDGRIWRLRDSDGDGLEDRAEPFWDRPTLSVPLGMAWSTEGLYVSSKGKVSLLRDTDGDGRADREDIVVSGWPATDVGSGGVDATAVTLDPEGNVYFGLLVADYSNAYRIRRRSDLKPADLEWLKAAGRWSEPVGPDAGMDEFSLYDLKSPRGTVQKWSPRTQTLETIATGIRVPVALAFNRYGDLFNTDQEGETWMPDGNPLDELNHIVANRNYGFPPRHERWLPGLVSEPPVVGFGPQHQSACGLVFNEPRARLMPHDLNPSRSGGVPLPVSPGQGLFGLETWSGDAFVAGESRGKIWRVRLVKTPQGYVGRPYTIARLSMLTMDLAISPRGDLYVCCHSGPPDWGTGPQGAGRIFRIRYTRPEVPQPMAVWPASPTEVRIRFSHPLDSGVLKSFVETAGRTNWEITLGEYVSAGDRHETLKPPYAVVSQQDAAPRGHLGIRSVRLDDSGKMLVLETEPHPLAVRYAIRIPGIRGRDAGGDEDPIELEYDLSRQCATPSEQWSAIGPAELRQRVAWAPPANASSGTDSRPAPKPQGDWEHGRELFTGAQLNCVKCHRIRGEGGTAGPDLSNLLHRDVRSIERDIRDPGATLHPDYVTYQAELKNGDTVAGFVRSQGGEDIRLFDAEGKETVVSRSEIVNLHPTGLSLMPSGLIDGLKADDLRDLLTFLMQEPPVRLRAAVDAAIGTNTPPTTAGKPRRWVLVASKQDHGPGQHDYPRWQGKWVGLLSQLSPQPIVEKAWEWPSDSQWATADAVVFYFWNHDWSAERYRQLDAFQQRGGGLVLLHSAVIADREPEALAERIGLSAQPGRTGYRHMPFELRFTVRDHSLTDGLPETLPFLDEPYWPLVGDPAAVTVLGVGQVDGQDRPLVWTFERGSGRVFASILDTPDGRYDLVPVAGASRNGLGGPGDLSLLTSAATRGRPDAVEGISRSPVSFLPSASERFIWKAGRQDGDAGGSECGILTAYYVVISDDYMRTTVTLDKDVERMLREAMHESRNSFKQTLNSAVRAGLSPKRARTASRPFVVQARPLDLRPRADPAGFNKPEEDDLEVDALMETSRSGGGR